MHLLYCRGECGADRECGQVAGGAGGSPRGRGLRRQPAEQGQAGPVDGQERGAQSTAQGSAPHKQHSLRHKRQVQGQGYSSLFYSNKLITRDRNNR